MKKLLLVLLASCGMTQRPGDLIGPGAMCEPVSDFKQICRADAGRKFVCVEKGGRWSCDQVEGPVFVK